MHAKHRLANYPRRCLGRQAMFKEQVARKPPSSFDVRILAVRKKSGPHKLGEDMGLYCSRIT